jgi:uncharacterized protein (TIGR02271 family)
MTRTLTALYDDQQDAQKARQELMAAGITDVEITAANGGSMGETSSASSGGGGGGGGGFLSGLKQLFTGDGDDRSDHHAYEEGLRRGGCLLTARVPDGQEDRAIQILDASGSIDFDDRQQQWRSEGWTGAQAASGSTTASEDAAIPIAREQLSVGRREVDRGTVRVRSYVVEEPVSEQVQLREEHVEVERTPVNERMAGAAQPGIFEERTFEISERGEEAVVAKETVVEEELRLHKDVDTHTETVQDTVRHTEVDVDDDRGLASRGPTPGGPRPV